MHPPVLFKSSHSSPLLMARPEGDHVLLLFLLVVQAAYLEY